MKKLICSFFLTLIHFLFFYSIHLYYTLYNFDPKSNYYQMDSNVHPSVCMLPFTIKYFLVLRFCYLYLSYLINFLFEYMNIINPITTDGILEINTSLILVNWMLKLNILINQLYIN